MNVNTTAIGVAAVLLSLSANAAPGLTEHNQKSEVSLEDKVSSTLVRSSDAELPPIVIARRCNHVCN